MAHEYTDGLFEGLMRREDGILRVAAHNETWLEWARHQAWLIVQEYGEVTSADIRVRAQAADRWPDHPNAWGAVFRGRTGGQKWVQTGDWVPCCHADGHARMVRVWTLV